MSGRTPVAAVVPIKALGDAKQRLSAVLSAEQRRALMMELATHVLGTVAAVPELDRFVVVTADPDAAILARKHGATPQAEGATGGHTAAVHAAALRLAAEGYAMLTLPADLPLLAPDDLRAMIEARRAAPSFTIAPSHDDGGSNAVLVSPADAVRLRFGNNSFFPHLQAARERGLEPVIVRRPGLALDIDNPEDLVVLRGRAVSRAVADILGWPETHLTETVT